MDHYVALKNKDEQLLDFEGGNRPISWQVPFFALSPDSIGHSHQPPTVIFGSFSCEMKPRSQLPLVFPTLYLYYSNAYRKNPKTKLFSLPQCIGLIYFYLLQ